jgi:biotin transport system substrate-specific component
LTAHAEPTTLRAALVPERALVADLALIVAGALLVAGAAQVSVKLPFTPVPITGQTFAVVLVGAGLGAVRGTASLTLYLLLGLALPFYAEGKHGWAVVSGASGGYLVGFVVAAALTGWLAQQGWDRRFSSAVTAMLTGNVVIYLFGLPWLAHSLDTGLARTLELGLYPFVPGDVCKLYLAGALLPGAWQLVGRLRG